MYSKPPFVFDYLNVVHYIAGVDVEMRDGFTALDTDNTVTAHMTGSQHVHSAIEYVQADSDFYLSDYATEEDHIALLASPIETMDITATFAMTRAVTASVSIGRQGLGGRAHRTANLADDEEIDGKTQLLAVEVFRNDGTADGNSVIAAVSWAMQNPQDRHCHNGTIANLPLGMASINDNVDTVDSSSASELSACTVSSSDRHKEKAEFSNYGSVVNIRAPGTNSEST
ncbi:hypothetical protein F4782DRAFT_527362 [Xylaria castorea]|nr:hypothetical protein F4782DRAFT_527362 [Xylaria castorea]